MSANLPSKIELLADTIRNLSSTGAACATRSGQCHRRKPTPPPRLQLRHEPHHHPPTPALPAMSSPEIIVSDLGAGASGGGASARSLLES